MSTQTTISTASPAAGAQPLKFNPLPLATLAIIFCATSIYVGIVWDISWHSTIGRDTFWTPAHMAIYLGGSGGGIIAGALAIWTTYFAAQSIRDASVTVWGGKAPFGAWVIIWGAIAMITSGPFDDWWHNAYGLDVKVISPPHVILFLGILGIIFGMFLLVLRWQNETPGKRAPENFMAYAGALMLGLLMVIYFSETWPNRQHGANFYYIVSIVYPLTLVALARASRAKWGATKIAIIYMAFKCLMCWILPLFPATPKLGPIFNPVDHMVPPPFPLLAVVPAIAIDVLNLFLKFGESRKRDWLLALWAGVLFVATFVPAQWSFANFLLSPDSRNWFFVGNRGWAYSNMPSERWFEFWGAIDDPVTPLRLAAFCVVGFLSARTGMAIGTWMNKLRR